jgi:hypothetical protein
LPHFIWNIETGKSTKFQVPSVLSDIKAAKKNCYLPAEQEKIAQTYGLMQHLTCSL